MNERSRSTESSTREQGMPVTLPGNPMFVLAVAALLAVKAAFIVALVYQGVQLALRARTSL